MLAKRIEIINENSESNVDFGVVYALSSGEEYVLLIQPEIKEGEIVKLHTPDSVEDYALIPKYEDIDELIAKMDELLAMDKVKAEDEYVVCAGRFTNYFDNYKEALVCYSISFDEGKPVEMLKGTPGHYKTVHTNFKLLETKKGISVHRYVDVYRDTIEPHGEDDNLIRILVDESKLKEFLGLDNPDKKADLKDFFSSYTADDTVALVDFLKKDGIFIVPDEILLSRSLDNILKKAVKNVPDNINEDLNISNEALETTTLGEKLYILKDIIIPNCSDKNASLLSHCYDCIVSGKYPINDNKFTSVAGQLPDVLKENENFVVKNKVINSKLYKNKVNGFSK